MPRISFLLSAGRILAVPPYHADLVIQDGKIAAIGRLDRAQARQVLDATGMAVSPACIDLMGKTGAPFLKEPNAAFHPLTQGIITLNAGEGESDGDGKR